MSHADEKTTRPVPPPLGNLLARYLDQRAVDQAEGLTAPDLGGEVVPFDAAPVQTVDARLAWQEATAVLNATVPAKTLNVPPEWPLVVLGQEPVVALAFAAGNFPQMVRQFQPMLHQGKLGELRTPAGRPIPAPALTVWAEQTLAKKVYPQAILALGALRLARHFDRADELAQQHRAEVPPAWRAAYANEEAALLWHRGRAEPAADLWNAQPESVAVLFNRGMAALFLDRPAAALASLTRAAEALPETGAWFHLAQLYLTLARMHA
jgi:hypothetical protein